MTDSARRKFLLNTGTVSLGALVAPSAATAAARKLDTRKSLDFRHDFIEQLKQAIDIAAAAACDDLPTDDQELVVNEGLRNVTRMLSVGGTCFIESDEAYPQLVKFESLQRQWYLPSTDTTYWTTPVNGKYSYTMSGKRGTPKIFELEIWIGHFSDLENVKFFSRLDHVPADADGNIVVKLSTNQQEGNWLRLPEGAVECTLIIRNYFYDWDNEQPSMLTIERDGAIYPPPPLSREKLLWGFNQALSLMTKATVLARAEALRHLKASPDEVPVKIVPSGFTKLSYLEGYFRCRDDEAVIMEVKPPKSDFWHFMLTNFQWEALDYWVRQTSLNGHQAVIDSDGVFRAVISQRDPGVANWLDAGGHHLGQIAGRYYSPDSKPVPKLKTVKLSELRQHLPADTKWVTAEERQAVIRRRKFSMTHRLCSD